MSQNAGPRQRENAPENFAKSVVKNNSIPLVYRNFGFAELTWHSGM